MDAVCMRRLFSAVASTPTLISGHYNSPLLYLHTCSHQVLDLQATSTAQ